MTNETRKSNFRISLWILSGFVLAVMFFVASHTNYSSMTGKLTPIEEDADKCNVITEVNGVLWTAYKGQPYLLIPLINDNSPTTQAK